MDTRYEVRSRESVGSDPIIAGVWDLVLHLRKLVGLGEMIIELELKFDGRLDDAILNRAVELLFEAEPILRRRLVIDAPRPEWQTVEEPQPQALLRARDAGEYEAFRHSGLNAATGPQVAVCLWHDVDCDRLIVKVTHEIADAAGVKTIGARLASIYTALEKDPGFVPQPNQPSPRGVEQVLERTSLLARPRLLWDLYKFGRSLQKPAESRVLLHPNGPSDPWVYITSEIEAQRVSRLAAYGRPHGATLNDIFLAAVYRALAGDAWRGESALRLFMTVDLRRWYLPASEAGSICNLSSFELPFLDRNLGADYDETLQRVVHLTTQRKRHHPGLAGSAFVHWIRPRGALKGAALERALNAVRDEHYLPLFTNMGPIDKDSLAFADLRPASAHLMAPKLNPHGLILGMSGYEGSLTLSAGTPLTSRETIASFIEQVIAQLPA